MKLDDLNGTFSAQRLDFNDPKTTSASRTDHAIYLKLKPSSDTDKQQ